MKTFNLLKNNYIILIFLIGFIFRVLISYLGFNIDLIIAAGWGDWVYKNGPKGFYENNVWIYAWPTQPPLMNLLYGFSGYIFDRLQWLFANIAYFIAIHRLAPTYFLWWFGFVKWFSTSLYSDTPFRIGFLISMKLLAIFSDIGIGILIYQISKNLVSYKKAAVLTAIFLMFPSSWYISSLWGQYDQLSTLLLLVSILFLYKKYFPLSLLFFLFAGQAKPTTVVFIPLYLFYFFYQRPSIKNIIISGGLTFGAFWLITAQFTDKNPLIYTFVELLPKVFFAERFDGLVNRAFNFWQFLMPFGGRSATPFLFIPAFWWGVGSFVFFLIWAIKLLKSDNSLKTLLQAFYMVGAGSYLFSTGMVDRYFFPNIVFLGLLTCFYPHLFKWWIITHIIFFTNIFYAWGFPFLTPETTWKNAFVIRFFGLSQVIVFFICLRQMKIKGIW